MVERSKWPFWRPWVEGAETPFNLGFDRGREARDRDDKYSPVSGYIMTVSELTEFLLGYKEGWNDR